MNDKVLIVSVLMVVMIVFFGTMVCLGSYLETHQSTTNIPTKEYRVFEHDIEPFRVYTNHGIFLFKTQEEWDRIELNHTYTCEETYSNVSLSNCNELRGE